MPVNRELVERKIALILQDLEQLRRLAGLTAEEFLSDPRHEALAERFLERTIGRLIDINFHLITEETQETPRDYHESFLRLGPMGILSAERARRFARLAGLRNRIAHEYNGLDEALIQAAVREMVEELPSYLAELRRHLES
jgi:uncharacterized protein YutE (UPF0331/DUF86 family)